MITTELLPLEFAPEPAASYSQLEESRHTVVYPWLAKAIAALKPRVVLDYGAGDGRFLEELSRLHSCDLWHFDPSPAMRQIAAAKLTRHNARFFETAGELPIG